jgi:hypothetical protein
MSDTNEPVAWAVTPKGKREEIDCEFVYPSAATAGDVALGCNGVVVPLYRSTALTDEEREAIAGAIAFEHGRGAFAWADTLRKLLSRIGDCPVPENAANESVRKTGGDFGQQPTLTDAERAAIAWCVEMAATTATECDEELAALRGLLERTK